MSRYRPKDNIFKTLGSYAKNYVHEVKNSIKSSKIVKKTPKSSKKYFFQNNLGWMPNMLFVGRMVWLLANTMTKRKKNYEKKWKKALKAPNMKISENEKRKIFFP